VLMQQIPQGPIGVADKRRGDWMQTFTGRAFWPLDPRPEEVSIVDIAWSLSMQCRYAGHCLRFYSVAEHAVMVSQLVPPEAALWGLLHDAPEAYLVDVPRPVKKFLHGYEAIEKALMHTIAERFGFSSYHVPESVKEADNRILLTERDTLMATPPQDWNIPGDPYPGLVLPGWSQHEAFTRFLSRFTQLTGEGYDD
jgi:hypothetical protein